MPMARILQVRPKSGETIFKSGGFIAEVLQSRSSDPFWYYVVQPIGSREIVAISRCNSHSEAKDAAIKALIDLASPAAASGE